MKQLFIMLLLAIAPTLAAAQQERPFDAKISNSEYKIYIRMNLYDKDVTVPGQDVYGQVDGYIGSTQSRNIWLVISSEVIDGRTGELEVVNDYGSEDFKAELKLNDDGTYTFKKKGGSTMKFAVKGKWQKIPGSFELQK